MVLRELDLYPVYTEVLSPERFVEVYAVQQNQIRSARVLAPQLGDADFGKILVTWKSPTYSVRSLRKNNGRSSKRRRR